MSVQDVAAILGKSAAWVSREANAQRIPHLKAGRDLRFEERDVEEFKALLRGEKQAVTTVGDDWGRKKRGA